jgi:hypothetical protein
VQQISSESLYSHQQSPHTSSPPSVRLSLLLLAHRLALGLSRQQRRRGYNNGIFRGQGLASSPESTVPNSTKQRNVTAAPREQLRELITNVELQIGLDKHAVAVMLHQVTLTAFFIVYGDLLTPSCRRPPPTSSRAHDRRSPCRTDIVFMTRSRSTGRRRFTRFLSCLPMGRRRARRQLTSDADSALLSQTEELP